MPRLSTKPEPCIAEALHRLDTMQDDVTEWEASWLDSVMRGTSWSPRQRAVLAKMCSQYLKDDLLAGEIYGQQRLF